MTRASSDDGPASEPTDVPRPGRAARATWVLALLVLALALGLRVVDIDAGRMSPDDGEFLHSARVHELDREAGPGRWLSEDVAWFRVLAEDFGKTGAQGRSTYQHGYLHQLATRWAYRLGGSVGLNRVSALRADQALLGTLTVLIVFLWLRRRAPGEPLVALAGASLLAVQLMHVHLSRTGWGQTGCTAFLVLVFALGWHLYANVGENDRRGLVWTSLGIALASLLAYGFHEMATVYMVVFAGLSLLLLWKAPNGTKRWPWYSRRVWAGLLACAPVGILTIGLLVFSEYARETWFVSKLAGLESLGWLEIRKLALIYFADGELVRQIGWPVLLLAPIGVLGAAARDVRWAVWLLAWLVLPTLLLFTRFNYPQLERIYLPANVVLVVLAAEGLGLLWCVTRERFPRAAVDALAAFSVLWMGAVTVDTIVRGPQNPLYVAGVHRAPRPEMDPRRTFQPIADALRAETLDEPVAVAFVWGPLYRLLDEGVAAEIFAFAAEGGREPRLVVAPVSMMGPRILDRGGSYVAVASDAYGQVALFRRADR